MGAGSVYLVLVVRPGDAVERAYPGVTHYTTLPGVSAVARLRPR